MRAAAGDHNGARRAAAEAAAARRDALREHAAAAAAIEAAHNRGRGLDAGTLDLHGLHIGEALAALARRHGGPVCLRPGRAGAQARRPCLPTTSVNECMTGRCTNFL